MSSTHLWIDQIFFEMWSPSQKSTKTKYRIFLKTSKIFRAEYSGRPGNFSGTFFQKGKTGGWWWFWWKMFFIWRNFNNWWKTLERPERLPVKAPGTPDRYLQHHRGWCSSWSPPFQTILSYSNINIVTAGDGCRGFEDVIMDEVKFWTSDLHLQHCQSSIQNSGQNVLNAGYIHQS